MQYLKNNKTKIKVFSPNEKLETPLAIDLIFMQIIRDLNASSCIRINDSDKNQLKKFLESKNLSKDLLADITHRHHNQSQLHQQISNYKLTLKKQIIDLAKNWPVYF